MPALVGGVLAVEQSLDGGTFVGVRAAPLADGRLGVEVAFMARAESDAWARVEAIMEDRQVALAVGATLQLHVPVALTARSQSVGQAELGKGAGLVRSMILAGKVVHRGEQLLAEHVDRCVPVTFPSGGQAPSQSRSPGPIELARCMIWAVALASKPQARRVKPRIVSSTA